jgi:hypothetical protein
MNKSTHLFLTIRCSVRSRTRIRVKTARGQLVSAALPPLRRFGDKLDAHIDLAVGLSSAPLIRSFWTREGALGH